MHSFTVIVEKPKRRNKLKGRHGIQEKRDSTKVKKIPRMSQDNSFAAGLNRKQSRIKQEGQLQKG